MSTIRCAILALFYCFASIWLPSNLARAQDKISVEDRAAYNAVAVALKAKNHDAAINALEKLALSTSLSMQRVVQTHLPVLLSQTGQHSALLDSLSSGKLSGQVSPDYSPQYFHCCCSALSRVANSHPAKAEQYARTLLEVIERHSNGSGELIQFKQVARLRLVSALCGSGNFDAATRELSADLRTTPAGQRLADHITLQRLSSCFETGKFRQCIALLKQTKLLERSSSAQAAMLRMLLLESAVATQDAALGLEQVKKLDKLLDETGLARPEAAASLSLNLPRLGLRKAEVLLLSKHFDACATTIEKLRPLTRDPKLAAEYSFLTSRLSVAQIDFETAKRTLAEICNTHAADSEPFARASWMLGEIAVMQRKYDVALEHYRRACSAQSHEKWRGNALFQMARCHEHLGEPTRSLAAYRQYLELSQQGQMSDEASRRIADLETKTGDSSVIKR